MLPLAQIIVFLGGAVTFLNIMAILWAWLVHGITGVDANLFYEPYTRPLFIPATFVFCLGYPIVSSLTSSRAESAADGSNEKDSK